VTGLFSDDSAAVDAGADYLRIAAMMMPAYTIMFVITALFQGLQRPVWSVVIGVYRQIIALALLPPIFVQFLGFGVTGVWLGLFCAVWSGLLLALVLAARVCSSTLGHVRPDFAALSARA
jgi:Na+-driven multidrug efflux pump